MGKNIIVRSTLRAFFQDSGEGGRRKVSLRLLRPDTLSEMQGGFQSGAVERREYDLPPQQKVFKINF